MSSQEIYCDYCLTPFAETSELTLHLIMEHGQNKFDTEEKTTKKVKRAHPCDYCDESFNSIAGIKMHLKNEHDVSAEELYPRPKIDDRKFGCDFCSESFYHKPGLEIHLLNAHNIKAKKPKPSKVSRKVKKVIIPKGPIECDFCDKTFHTDTGYRQHIRAHKGERIFEQSKERDKEAKELGISPDKYLEMKVKEQQSDCTTENKESEEATESNRSTPTKRNTRSSKRQKKASEESQKIKQQECTPTDLLDTSHIVDNRKDYKNFNKSQAIYWKNASQKVYDISKKKRYQRKCLRFWELYQVEKNRRDEIKKAIQENDDITEVGSTEERTKDQEQNNDKEKKVVCFNTNLSESSEKKTDSDDTIPNITFNIVTRSRDKKLTSTEGSTDDKQSPKNRNKPPQHDSIGNSQIIVPKDINNNEEVIADKNQGNNNLPELTHGNYIIPDERNGVTDEHNECNQSNNVLSSASHHKSVPKHNEAKGPEHKPKKTTGNKANEITDKPVPKKYTTKDPKCKFDKELLKEKTYSLRSSQRPRKHQDGDDSKDLDWAPNKSDLSNSQEVIMIDANKASPKKKVDLKRKHQNVVPQKSTNDTSKDSKKDAKRRKCSDQMQHPCEKCGTMFDKYWEYTVHTTYCGIKAKNIVCLVKGCQKVFDQKILFKQHFKYHHTDEPKDFVCDECDTDFVYKKTLITHNDCIHTPNADKNFMCDTCGQLFAKQWEYSNHRRNSHSVDRPYLCGICKKSAFPTAERLKQHLQRSGKEKTIECKQCGKKFIMMDNLIKHVNDTHRKDLVWMCPVQACPNQYQSKGGWYQHLQDVHGISRKNSNTYMKLKKEKAFDIKEEESEAKSDASSSSDEENLEQKGDANSDDQKGNNDVTGNGSSSEVNDNEDN